MTNPTGRWAGIDHVQLAIPVGAEDVARAFYVDVFGLVEVDIVEGRSNRYRFPVTMSAGAQGSSGTISAGAQGGERRRAGGYSPARHVSSNYSSILPGEPPDDGRPRMSMAAWLEAQGTTLGQARGSEWG